MEQNSLFGTEEIEGKRESHGGGVVVHAGVQSTMLTAEANAEKAGCGVSARRLMQKFKTQEFRCFFSGQVLEREEASLDHVVPIVKGGRHEESNIELVHATINRMKGSMMAEEFVQWCVKVAVHSGGCTLPKRQNSQK